MNISLHTQRGISLLSLMVSMAIGIFLVGGVVKIYADSKSSFNTRTVVSEVTESQRFAIDDIRRIIVMAGRSIRLVDEIRANRRPFPAVDSTGVSGIVDTSDGSGGILIGSDVIAIRYRRGPSCGAYQNASLNDPPSRVRIFITDQDSDGARDDLVCELTTYVTTPPVPPATTPTTPGTATTRILASNIHMLKALYGVDTDDDGYADSYITPTAVNALTTPAGSQTPWSRVVSMRIALMVGSDSTLPLPSRPPTPVSHNVLTTPVPEPDTAHLYKVASTTLALRNLNTAIQRQ